MPYGMYVSAEGAQCRAQRIEVIANNLANVDTVGFKRELAVFQARYAEAIDRGQATAGAGSIHDLGGGVQVAPSKTDFSSGPMKFTKTPTDLAIDGEGFFVVRQGRRALPYPGRQLPLDRPQASLSLSRAIPC